MCYLMYGSLRIEYQVVRSSRKTVSVIVDPAEGVVVRAPQRVNESQIQEIVLKKAPWILEKMKTVRELVGFPSKKEFVSGESFLYLGRHYRLKVFKAKEKSSKVSLVGGRFKMCVDSSLNEEMRERAVRDALLEWYVAHANQHLRERVGVYSSKVDVNPSGIVVKRQLRRWGSCTKNKVVAFNWKIIMAPLSVVDYVVVHELCHMRMRDHSPDFWVLLRSIMPDYEERRAWLRVNGRRLSL